MGAGWRTLAKPSAGAPGDALRGRVRRDELGMLGLQRDEFAPQRVVLRVADLRVVEHVIAVRVVVDRSPQRVEPLRDAVSHPSASPFPIKLP